MADFGIKWGVQEETPTLFSIQVFSRDVCEEITKAETRKEWKRSYLMLLKKKAHIKSFLFFFIIFQTQIWTPMETSFFLSELSNHAFAYKFMTSKY